MHNNPKSKILVASIAALLVMSPLLQPSGGLMGVDQAYAKGKGSGNGGGGGNGGGNSGGHGNASHGGNGGNGNSATASAASSTQGGGTEGKLTGPMAATHASATAFMHAAPNSRVGKWMAYYQATIAAGEAAATADATDAQALQATFEASAPQDVTDAYVALQADPTNQTLIDAYNQAITDNNLSDDEVAAVEQAYADWQAAVAADEAAATLQGQADGALLAANNNRPVDDATRAVLDQTLADKLGQ